jgi:hypothetical protein
MSPAPPCAAGFHLFPPELQTHDSVWRCGWRDKGQLRGVCCGREALCVDRKSAAAHNRAVDISSAAGTRFTHRHALQQLDTIVCTEVLQPASRTVSGCGPASAACAHRSSRRCHSTAKRMLQHSPPASISLTTLHLALTPINGCGPAAPVVSGHVWQLTSLRLGTASRDPTLV